MTLLRDVAFTFRVWRRSPAGVVACVLMLAIGLAAAATTVSAMQTISSSALPFERPGELVQIFQRFTPRANMDRMSVAPANYRDWTQATSFSGMAAYRQVSLNMTGRAGAERVRAVQADPALFTVVGTRPLLGRTLQVGDSDPALAPPVVISASLWARSFDHDEQVIGRTVALNGQSHTIVGVMPARFRFPIGWTLGDVEAWTPLRLTPTEADTRQNTTLEVVARLRQGVSRVQAQSEMDGITSALALQHPATNTNWASNVLPLSERISGGLGRTLLMLGLAVAALLVIMCVNVANLLLARGMDRQTELAVRAALGADRGRLIRQLLVEGLVLALVAASVGLIVAGWLVQLVSGAAPAGPLRELQEMRLSASTIGLTYAIALIVGLVFSVVPALLATGRQLRTTLADHGRTGDAIGLTRLKSLLVVVELALAVTLLICGSSVLSSFTHAMSIDPGFDSRQALTFKVTLPVERYREPADWLRYFERLEEAAKAVPGVTHAGLGSGAPMDGGGAVFRYRVLGVPPPAPEERASSAEFMRVGADYFAAAGIGLKAGRTLTSRDGHLARVAIVNESFVRRLPEGTSAIGAQVVLQGDLNRSTTAQDAGAPIEIIGVVADTKHYAMHLMTPPMIYVPLAQDPSRAMSLVVRADGDPATLWPDMRRVLAALDPEVPMFGARTFTEVVHANQAMFRVNTWIFAALGVIAWLVSIVGVYGVFANMVARRRFEFGLRAALGASRRHLVTLVMVPSVWLSVSGLVIGIALSWPAFNLVALMLKQALNLDLTPDRLGIGLAVGATMVVSAAVATLIPSIRASRADPASVWR